MLLYYKEAGKDAMRVTIDALPVFGFALGILRKRCTMARASRLWLPVSRLPVHVKESSIVPAQSLVRPTRRSRPIRWPSIAARAMRTNRQKIVLHGFGEAPSLQLNRKAVALRAGTSELCDGTAGKIRISSTIINNESGSFVLSD